LKVERGERKIRIKDNAEAQRSQKYAESRVAWIRQRNRKKVRQTGMSVPHGYAES
jgi:hypothetical protein